MIHFSTLPSGLYPAETDDYQIDTSTDLSKEDQAFLAVVRARLNKEMKEPSAETVAKILLYSASLHKK